MASEYEWRGEKEVVDGTVKFLGVVAGEGVEGQSALEEMYVVAKEDDDTR